MQWVSFVFVSIIEFIGRRETPALHLVMQENADGTLYCDSPDTVELKLLANEFQSILSFEPMFNRQVTCNQLCALPLKTLHHATCLNLV